jgi:hypothetical protein
MYPARAAARGPGTRTSAGVTRPAGRTGTWNIEALPTYAASLERGSGYLETGMPGHRGTPR